MRKYLAAVVLSLSIGLGCASAPAQQAPVRIDASSEQAADASYKAMMAGLSPADQQKLAMAVFMLNMQGVKSAFELANNPQLQSPSIGRIRAQVGGMTAAQIIALAAKNPSVRVQVNPGK